MEVQSLAHGVPLGQAMSHGDTLGRVTTSIVRLHMAALDTLLSSISREASSRDVSSGGARHINRGLPSRVTITATTGFGGGKRGTGTLANPDIRATIRHLEKTCLL